MQTLKTRLKETSIDLWLWLFPVTYLIHIAEEYWGGEGYSAYILRIRGVHLSPARFWIAQSIGLVLITIGVLLARRFTFPRMMLVILGTTVLVNALTHAVTSLSLFSYGPGLVSSILIWLPLGVLALIRVKDETPRRRFWIGVAIGVVVNVCIGIITMRGGRLV
jgi:Protein of unknown function with HXXEE motif